MVTDPSLCQFCIAGTLRGIQGKSDSIVEVLLSTVIFLIDGPSATTPRPEDLGSRDHDGGYLFFRSVCRRTEEVFLSSRYRQTNFEANDTMRLFHSAVCTTRFWR